MSGNPSAFTATPGSIGAAPAAAATWEPSDNGLLGAIGDLWAAQSTNLLTAGTVYLTRLPIRAAQTISTLTWGITAAGVGASTGSFGGLISSAGTLLSGSADAGAAMLAAGPLPVTLTTPQAVAAGSFPWAALVANLATTQPTMRTANGRTTDLNLNLAAASFRFAVNGTGQVALSSITPSANTQGAALALWCGWS
jgi:hypothetical protein